MVIVLSILLAKDVFTQMRLEGASSSEIKPRVPNEAVGITRDSRLTLECDEMLARHAILLSKFKLEEQLCFAVQVNIMHIQRLQDRLNALVKYIKDNDLNQ